MFLLKIIFKKIQISDSSYFRGKSHFVDNGTQNYLIFQPIYIHFGKEISSVDNGEYIYSWKSKVLSNERINFITAYEYSITPELSYYGSKIRVKFNGGCLKQDKPPYTHGKIVNIYIVLK